MTLPLEYGKFVNIGIIVFIIISMILGFKRGVLWQAIKTLGVLAASLLAYIVSPGLAGAVKVFPEAWTPFQNSELFDLFYTKLNTISWFIIVFLAASLLLLLLRPLFKSLLEKSIVKKIDAVLGAVFSIVPVYCLLVVITFALNTPLVANGKDFISSTFLKHVDNTSKNLTVVFDKVFSQNQAIQKMLSDPLTLTSEDIKQLIVWMKSNKIDTSSITSFLEKYGISLEKINALIAELEGNNE